ncbi:MAG TPA: type IV pilus secretin PilQ [Smithellaceae bacterium]|nr:type IV pilus secretin PilQ [Smithellaceae bacterium]HRS89215.1 type IV pilus secretin PilQ [Smithellaceae bacterium]HRV26139.1 type IV pilus secretin PilQ [Smithellaceae bacterium]
MKRFVFKKRLIMAAAAVAALAFLCGCATSNKKDPFFEKWSTMADTSQGRSPAAETRKLDVDSIAPKTESSAALSQAGIRRLPTKPINLTMRQAELRSVLRAMAKSVDLNILVKNDLQGEISVDFRGVPWDQAFTGLLRTHALTYVWEGEVLLVKTVDDIEKDLKRKVQLRDISWVEPLLQPVVIKVNFANAKKLTETLQEFLTKDKDGKPRGSVRLDEHSNSLVISAIHEDLVRMLGIIEQIDKPTPQILIKANIVETTKNVARDLGILWGGMYKKGELYVTPGGSQGTGDPLTGAYTPTQGAGAKGIGGQGFAGSFPIANIAQAAGAGSLGLIIGKIGGNLLEIQLQALQKDNKLNILSSPSITTLDNQKAYTENGERVPYVTREIDSSGRETRTVKFEDVVLRLEITPHVIDGKNLKMTILVKKDEVDPLRNVEGNPFIIKKQTETVLIVEDGETIVISGLTKQRIADGDAGWPLFKDIPVLGYLFKADSKSEAMEEVLIFITPHILQAALKTAEAAPVSIDANKASAPQNNAAPSEQAQPENKPAQ